MEITGKIISKLDLQSGTSKAGNQWKKQEYVLETQDAYPRKVHFDFFGERADQYNLNIGDVIKLSFDIESREYQGRWYTSIRGWKAEPADAAAATAPVQQVAGSCKQYTLKQNNTKIIIFNSKQHSDPNRNREKKY